MKVALRMRHGRQVSLAEVGAAGQARIDAARVDVGLDGLAGHVSVRYLAGAGVGRRLAQAAREVDRRVTIEIDPALGSGAEEKPLLPLAVRDPVARELARGAYHALAALRTAIGLVR